MARAHSVRRRGSRGRRCGLLLLQGRARLLFLALRLLLRLAALVLELFRQKVGVERGLVQEELEAVEPLAVHELVVLGLRLRGVARRGEGGEGRRGEGGEGGEGGEEGGEGGEGRRVRVARVGRGDGRAGDR